MKHPSTEQLVRYREEVASATEAEKVRLHVEACESCQAEMLELDALDALLSRPRVHAMPESSWDVVQARLARGDVVNLRSTGSAGPRRWVRWLVAAGVVGLAASVTLAIVATPPLAAGNSRLDLDSEPGSPSMLRVSYESAGFLAAADRVVLRGEVWQWGDIDAEFGSPIPVSVTLDNEGPGRHSGLLPLPDASTFGWLLVEDSVGGRIDSGLMPRWEFLQRDDAGAPTRAALVQKVSAYLEVNRRVALETASELTRRFPDDPFGWSRRIALEVAGANEESRAQYREVLERLDRRYRPMSASAQTVAALFDLSVRLGADAMMEYWRTRLIHDHPGHIVAGNQQAIDIYGEFENQPRARLDALEDLWTTSSDRVTTSALGYESALELGDPGTVQLWATRLVEELPNRLPQVVSGLSQIPDLRTWARAAGEQGLREFSGVSRPLFQTGAQQERSSARRRSALFVALGESLLATGQRDSALAMLGSAVPAVWDPALFRTLARLHLDAADTTTAKDLLARVAYDPLGVPPGGLQLSELVEPGSAEWRGLADSARVALASNVEAMLDDVAISADLGRADGESIQLRDAWTDTPITLMAFWHLQVPEVRDGLKALEPFLALLQQKDVRAIGIVGRPLRVGPQGATPATQDIETYVDVTGQVADVVHRWPRATHFVVEDGRRIRYGGGLEDAIRVAIVLREKRP